jgi:hypothetical protein
MPYIDGATSMTFPVRRVIEEFEPTDLLVFANRSGFTRKGALLDRLVSTPMLLPFPRAVRTVHAERHEHALEELEYLRSQKRCRYLILWSDNQLGRFKRDPVLIESGAIRAQRHLEDLLADARARTTASSTLAAE